MKLKLNIQVDEKALAREVMEQGLYNDFVNSWIDAADEFQQNTPVGVTEELKRGWDIEATPLSQVTNRVSVKITNTAPYSSFRVAGRGPGKPPPISAIRSWARLKGLNPYAVQKGIGRRGTRRWRDKDNWVGINNDNTFISGGRIEQIADSMRQRFRTVTFRS